MAWQASFSERGLPVPQGGPRDGNWGKGGPAMVKDTDVGYREAEVHRPGFVEVDASGMQVHESAGARAKVLVVGGSVAWGAFASTEEETYFAYAARFLQDAGWPVRFTILAAGGWTSENELSALSRYGLAQHPDVIIFLDGLNDVTLGTGRRVRKYVDRIRRARDLAEANGAVFVMALQPALSFKHNKSRLEKRIVELTQDEPFIPEAYLSMRSQLAALADGSRARFLDCSEALNGEKATTFADIWHFGDPGQRLLGRCLAEGLSPVLRALSEGSTSG